MEKILSFLIAALGVWLIVAISVFPDRAALWLAFAGAIAITAVASVATGVGYVRGERIFPAFFAGVAGLGAFLIVASLVFEGASLGWLQAIAGGVVEFVALGSLALRAAARPALAVAPAAPERQAI